MLIIGSRALAYYNVGLQRTPTDLDTICTMSEMVAFTLRHNLKPVMLLPTHYIVYDAPEYGAIEFEISDTLVSNQRYMEYSRSHEHFIDVYGEQVRVAPLEVLYSIKRSHRYYPKSWEKHINDYHLLKKLVGDVDVLAEVTKIREQETKERWGVLKTPSLNKKTTEFFDDNVSNKTFVHDEIHAVMAHREKPMYEYIKVDPDKVTCSKEKFLALPFEDRVRCVLEEAYVIALERAIIPMLFEGKQLADGESALRWSLMRIGTTLTSGWFRNFAVEHYPEIWAAHSVQYVQKFLQAVDDGRIKRIEVTQ